MAGTTGENSSPSTPDRVLTLPMLIGVPVAGLQAAVLPPKIGCLASSAAAPLVATLLSAGALPALGAVAVFALVTVFVPVAALPVVAAAPVAVDPAPAAGA